MYHEIDLNSAPPTEEPDRQYYYMAKCREWVKNFQQKNGHLPKSFVVNMGCQMNARDSEKLRGILAEIGYVPAESEEADFVIDLLRNHEINGPVAYDWEMHDSSYRVYGTSPEMATACAIAFCKRIQEAGYTPMIYAGTYVSYVKYDQGAIAPYLCWYPEYKSDSSEKLCPTLYYQPDYWQFSSKCSVAGIGGNVDANIQFIR